MVSYVILAADQGRARLFTSDKRVGPMTEIQGFANPEARLREQELVTDGSSGNPHDLGNQGRAHAHVTEKFAREVSRALDQVVTKHNPERVYVVSSPQFLGLLRPLWSNNLKAKIAQELPKDVSQLPPDQIRAHLPDLL